MIFQKVTPLGAEGEAQRCVLRWLAPWVEACESLRRLFLQPWFFGSGVSTMNDATEPSEQAAESPLSFERALERIEAIVRMLEDGRGGLDESLKLYEEGVKLLRRCHQVLQRAEERIELLAGLTDSGEAIVTDFDARQTFAESPAPPSVVDRSLSADGFDSAGSEVHESGQAQASYCVEAQPLHQFSDERSKRSRTRKTEKP